ncbi:hypothetical protein [Mesorhizobium sp. IMUNJ 23232]|uniref:hypothetical protein n=1 Tax=Mesorhizobium sp. IMUNJ 23232 TaxID=3376064 RepID=UPI0037B3971F
MPEDDKADWYEVWVDETQRPPYVLFLFHTSDGRHIVYDPKADKIPYVTPSYGDARYWLSMDEYVQVEGRQRQDEPVEARVPKLKPGDTGPMPPMRYLIWTFEGLSDLFPDADFSLHVEDDLQLAAIEISSKVAPVTGNMTVEFNGYARCRISHGDGRTADKSFTHIWDQIDVKSCLYHLTRQVISGDIEIVHEGPE